jgi:hypothetical protein
MNARNLWSCLLAATLAVAAAACGAMEEKADITPYTTNELLALLPADARVVFALDTQRMFEEEYFQKLLEPEGDRPPTEHSLPQQYTAFKEKTGIDWREDVRLVVGSAAGNPSSRETPMAVLVNVRHDPKRILAAVDAQADLERRPVSHGDGTIHELYSVQGEQRELAGAFAFLGDSLMVFGSPAEVGQVMDRRAQSPGVPAFGERLASLVAQADGRAMGWVAMQFDPAMREALPAADDLPFKMPFSLEAFDGLYGSLDYRNFILNGDFRVLSTDAATNEQIAALLNGLRAMGAMREGAMGKLMNTILITSDDKQIRVSFSVPEDLLRELAVEMKNQTVPFMDMPQFGVPGQPQEVR